MQIKMMMMMMNVLISVSNGTALLTSLAFRDMWRYWLSIANFAYRNCNREDSTA